MVINRACRCCLDRCAGCLCCAVIYHHHHVTPTCSFWPFDSGKCMIHAPKLLHSCSSVRWSLRVLKRYNRSHLGHQYQNDKWGHLTFDRIVYIPYVTFRNFDSKCPLIEVTLKNLVYVYIYIYRCNPFPWYTTHGLGDLQHTSSEPLMDIRWEGTTNNTPRLF